MPWRNLIGISAMVTFARRKIIDKIPDNTMSHSLIRALAAQKKTGH